MIKNKALFLDRDGTINFDSGYVFEPDRVKILEGVSESIAKAKEAGFFIIIVTNQSSIGRGYCTFDEVNQTNKKVEDLLVKENINATIDHTFIAPDHPDNPTPRRKPQPGMIHEALGKFKLDINHCWIIGDKITDPETGINAGMPANQCLKVSPNRDTTERSNKTQFMEFTGLKEAINFIIPQ